MAIRADLTLHEVRDVELGNSAKVFVRATVVGSDPLESAQTQELHPRRRLVRLGPEHGHRLRFDVPDRRSAVLIELMVIVENSFDESENGEEVYAAVQLPVGEFEGDHVSQQMEGEDDQFAEVVLSGRLSGAAPEAEGSGEGEVLPPAAPPASGIVSEEAVTLDDIQAFDVSDEEDESGGAPASSSAPAPAAAAADDEFDFDEPDEVADDRRDDRDGRDGRDGRRDDYDGRRDDYDDRRDDRRADDSFDDSFDRDDGDDYDGRYDRSQEQEQGQEQGQEQEPAPQYEEEEERQQQPQDQDDPQDDQDQDDQDDDPKDWVPVDWVVDILLGGVDPPQWDYGVATQFSRAISTLRVDYGESNYDISLDPQHVRLVECNDKRSEPLFDELCRESSWPVDWRVSWFNFEDEQVYHGRAVFVVEMQNSIVTERDGDHERARVPLDNNLKLLACHDEGDSRPGRRSQRAFDALMESGEVLGPDDALFGENAAPTAADFSPAPLVGGSPGPAPAAGTGAGAGPVPANLQETMDSLADEVRRVTQERHDTLMLVKRVFYDGDVKEGGQQLLKMADEEPDELLDVSSRSIDLLRQLEEQIRSTPMSSPARDVQDAPMQQSRSRSPEQSQRSPEPEPQRQPEPKPQPEPQPEPEKEPEPQPEPEPELPEPVELDVFVGTFNTGNAGLHAGMLNYWLPEQGGSHDVIAVGLQETRIKKKKKKQQQQEGAGAPASDVDMAATVADFLGDEFQLAVQHESMQLLLLVFVRRAHAEHVDGVRVAQCLLPSDFAAQGAQQDQTTDESGKPPSKGAVVAALSVYGTSVAFVNCHLEGHEGAQFLDTRNRSCAEIIEAARMGESEQDMEVEFLYHCHHVLWFGDLNYRVNLNRDDAASPLGREEHWERVHEAVLQRDWQYLLENDELTEQLHLGRCLEGFVEPPVRFPPTFKVERDSETQFSERSIPSFTDRVLVHSLPARSDLLRPANPLEACADMLGSDHKPVRGSFALTALPRVPVLDSVQPGKAPALELTVLSDVDVGAETEMHLYTDPQGLFGQDTLVMPVVPRAAEDDAHVHVLQCHVQAPSLLAHTHIIGSVVAGGEFVGQCVVPLAELVKQPNAAVEASVPVFRGGRLQMDVIVRAVLRTAGGGAGAGGGGAADAGMDTGKAGCKCVIQ